MYVDLRREEALGATLEALGASVGALGALEEEPVHGATSSLGFLPNP